MAPGRELDGASKPKSAEQDCGVKRKMHPYILPYFS